MYLTVVITANMISALFLLMGEKELSSGTAEISEILLGAASGADTLDDHLFEALRTTIDGYYQDLAPVFGALAKHAGARRATQAAPEVTPLCRRLAHNEYEALLRTVTSLGGQS